MLFIYLSTFMKVGVLVCEVLPLVALTVGFIVVYLQIVLH